MSSEGHLYSNLSQKKTDETLHNWTVSSKFDQIINASSFYLFIWVIHTHANSDPPLLLSLRRESIKDILVYCAGS